MTDPVAAARAVLGDRAQTDVALGPLTTYRVGGAARLFVTVEGTGDLALVHDAVVASGVPVLIVGKGSNLLVADAGFPGLAITLGEAYASVTVDATKVVAGAAAFLPVVARRTAAEGLTGFEWAVGVPGSIGGAVRMNAGGHGSDMAATVTRVRVGDVVRGEDEWVDVAHLDLGYRRSNVAAYQLVLAAELALQGGDRAGSEAEITSIVRWRRENQPGGQNAGSVFTNPPGDSAGRLIDEAGCKGLRVGTAQVATKHANFIVADAGGRADDVAALMAEMQRRVLDATGVELEPETKLIGTFGARS